MSGVPFAANPLTGLYYPLNWLLLFLPGLPLDIGFNLSALVHLSLAGAAMYALMRHGFDTGVWAALVAAIAYQGSPKLLAHLGVGHVGWVQAWAWVPIVALCLFKASQPSGTAASRWGVGAGVGLAVQFCADVRMAAYTLIAAATCLLARMLGHSDSAWQGAIQRLGSEARHVTSVIRGFVVFLGLSACQWLPAFAILPDTTRSSMSLSDAAVWSLPWRYLGGLLLADHGGFHEWMTYTGVGTLVFAFFGARSFWRRRDRRSEIDGFPVRRWVVGWLVGLAVFATWFSLGENGGLFQILWRVVPGLGLLRVPPRAWVLVVFATAVLAGLGLEETERLRDRERKGAKRWRPGWQLAAGALPPMLLTGYWLLFGRPPLNLTMFGVVTPLAILLHNMRHAGSARSWSGVAAVLLVGFDLWVVDATLIEVRSPEEVFAPGQATAEWLAERAPGFRVYSPSYSVPQHLAERYRLALASGVDPLQLRAYADYLTRAAGLEPPQQYSVALPPLPEGAAAQTGLQGVIPDAEMLAQLNVRYVVAAFPVLDGRLKLVHRSGDTYVYWNRVGHDLAQKERPHSIVLANGEVLYQYRAWPVYAGWGISCFTLAALIGWIVYPAWRARRDG